MKSVTLPVLSKFVFEKLVVCNWFISLPVIKEKKKTALMTKDVAQYRLNDS